MFKEICRFNIKNNKDILPRSRKKNHADTHIEKNGNTRDLELIRKS